MFFTTSRLIETLTEYSKLPDGTWAAELRTPRLRVAGFSPVDCRHELLSHFDALLAEWLTESPANAELGARIGSPDNGSDWQRTRRRNLINAMPNASTF